MTNTDNIFLSGVDALEDDMIGNTPIAYKLKREPMPYGLREYWWPTTMRVARNWRVASTQQCTWVDVLSPTATDTPFISKDNEKHIIAGEEICVGWYLITLRSKVETQPDFIDFSQDFSPLVLGAAQNALAVHTITTPLVWQR
jgi:hypothetical protein